MPSYTVNPNDANTVTAALSSNGSATTTIDLSGFTQFDVNAGGLNPTDGFAVGSIFTVGAGSNEYEITAIDYRSSVNEAHLTVTPVFGSPESAGSNSGATVTRKFKGTHKSLKDHLRLRNLGHI